LAKVNAHLLDLGSAKGSIWRNGLLAPEVVFQNRRPFPRIAFIVRVKSQKGSDYCPPHTLDFCQMLDGYPTLARFFCSLRMQSFHQLFQFLYVRLLS
jgi:hypothetical protein